eukprot:m.13453 g.13453  ORF g.13453 m.13453 type:complete len:189 (+) comp10159_c0_seq1:3-569(+)
MAALQQLRRQIVPVCRISQAIRNNHLATRKLSVLRAQGTLYCHQPVHVSTQSPARPISVCVTLKRNLTTDNQLPAVVDYAFVKDAVSNGGYMLLDVRTLGEYLSGAIPSSCHMDLNDVQQVCSDIDSIEPDDFIDTYGFELPAKDTAIVVYCQSGVRSNYAQRVLQAAGYTNVANYKGSWSDWSQHDA